MPDIAIEVSSSILPIQPVNILEITHDIIPTEARTNTSEPKGSPLFAPSEQPLIKATAENVPGNIFQQFPVKRNSPVLDQVLNIFKELAEEGHLMHEFKNITSDLQERLNTTLDQVVHHIKQAERLKLLNVIKRQFGTL